MTDRPRKLILTNFQAPGDVVMLTAAVRDLHLTYPGQFLTDVRTPFPELWENNPFLTSLEEWQSDVDVIPCYYPLIDRANQVPRHFVEGFSDFLNGILGVSIEVKAFHGDIHLSQAEKGASSPLKEIMERELPFWILVAGGKSDYTIKWWSAERFQKVVDELREEVLFVQVGSSDDHHPDLEGVLDLRGKTNLRDLIRLVYHSEGVVSPVTMAMHLAAAVEVRSGVNRSRPCVVVAGGREPPTWEAYPSHQFLHTVGALECCATGGCWRARTIPLYDGSSKDADRQLCLDVVDSLPRCMAMIESTDVVRAVRRYLDGGMARGLEEKEREFLASRIPSRQFS